VIAEEDPVVLRPEPDQRRRDAFPLFGSAFTRENVATQRLENPDRDGLLYAADISLSLVRQDDLFAHRVYGSRLIFSQSAMERPNSAST